MIIPKFETKRELFDYLLKNKKELIEFKKGQLKKTDLFGDAIEDEARKALNTSYKDDVSSGVIKRTVIANTYFWMDSHDDVHLDNVFSNSIANRQDKIFHLHDHLQMVTAKIGIPAAIYEKSVEWKDLGVEIAGSTTCLFLDSNIYKDLNHQTFIQYLKGEITQHSVGMIYIKLALALNDPDSKAEFFEWNKTINLIGNKEKAMERGYFWAIYEAKLIEISAVLSGSNELTNMVTNEEKAKPEEKEEVNKGLDFKLLTTLLEKDRVVADLGIVHCDNCRIVIEEMPESGKCYSCGQFIHQVGPKSIITPSLVENFSKLKL